MADAMTIDDILQQLADGATLEGPHWTEPVKVLAVKARDSRVEVRVVNYDVPFIGPRELTGQAQFR
jgi:hypothetical protein